jgi:preprotein translocase subunit SecE
VKDYLPLFIGTVIVGALFAFLWRQGHVTRLATYVGETREELRKCNWPTREELIQSTILVFVVIGVLALFTVGIDFVVLGFVKALLKGS